MNYSFIRKKYLVLVLFIAAATYTAHAQIPPRLVKNGSVINIVSPGGQGLISRDLENKEYTYQPWLETGDGNYINDFNPMPSLQASDPRKYPAFMLTARLYDNRSRPPRTTASIVAAEQPLVTEKIYTSPLSTFQQKQIKLITSVGDVVADDPMVAGVSFRVPVGNYNYRIVFSYNNPKGATFKTVSVTTPSALPGADGTLVTTLPDIRVFDGASVTAKNVTGEYTNAIVLEKKGADSYIHNIFFTLVPLKTVPALSSIKAELFLQAMGSEEWKIQDTDEEFLTGGDAHDPNDIAVDKECLPLNQGAKLHYTINFQNMGVGDASTVKVAFFHPKEMNLAAGIQNLKAKYSGITGWNCAVDYSKERSCYIFTLEPAGTDVLYGTDRSANIPDHPKSMGSVTFDIDVSAPSGPQAPRLVTAGAEIYLLSQNGSPDGIADNVTDQLIALNFCIKDTKNFELPVHTGNAYTLFSDNCKSCVEEKCKCSNPHSFMQWFKCYWWLVVMGILVVLLFWLLYKLRRRPSN